MCCELQRHLNCDVHIGYWMWILDIGIGMWEIVTQVHIAMWILICDVSYSDTYIAMCILDIGCGYWYWYVRDSDTNLYCDVDIGTWCGLQRHLYCDVHIGYWMGILDIGIGMWKIVTQVYIVMWILICDVSYSDTYIADVRPYLSGHLLFPCRHGVSLFWEIHFCLWKRRALN